MKNVFLIDTCFLRKLVKLLNVNKVSFLNTCLFVEKFTKILYFLEEYIRICALIFHLSISNISLQETFAIFACHIYITACIALAYLNWSLALQMKKKGKITVEFEESPSLCLNTNVWRLSIFVIIISSKEPFNCSSNRKIHISIRAGSARNALIA